MSEASERSGKTMSESMLLRLREVDKTFRTEELETYALHGVHHAVAALARYRVVGARTQPLVLQLCNYRFECRERGLVLEQPVRGLAAPDHGVIGHGSS